MYERKDVNRDLNENRRNEREMGETLMSRQDGMNGRDGGIEGRIRRHSFNRVVDTDALA